jgi:hypothetical protein
LEAAELAQQFFSQAEAKAVKVIEGLARLRTFYQLWSLKEAALKSIGEGLPFGLDAFEFELAPKLRVAHAPPDYGGPEGFNAQIINGTDICAALVIFIRGSQIRLRQSDCELKVRDGPGHWLSSWIAASNAQRA